MTYRVQVIPVGEQDDSRLPSMASDPRTETPGMSERDLLENAVRLALPRGRGRGKHPRWVAVMDTFALGSGYSHALCRRFGFDPDEKVGQ